MSLYCDRKGRGCSEGSIRVSVGVCVSIDVVCGLFVVRIALYTLILNSIGGGVWISLYGDRKGRGCSEESIRVSVVVCVSIDVVCGLFVVRNALYALILNSIGGGGGVDLPLR